MSKLKKVTTRSLLHPLKQFLSLQYFDVTECQITLLFFFFFFLFLLRKVLLRSKISVCWVFTSDRDL